MDDKYTEENWPGPIHIHGWHLFARILHPRLGKVHCQQEGDQSQRHVGMVNIWGSFRAEHPSPFTPALAYWPHSAKVYDNQVQTQMEVLLYHFNCASKIQYCNFAAAQMTIWSNIGSGHYDFGIFQILRMYSKTNGRHHFLVGRFLAR